MLKAVPHTGLNGSFNETARTEDIRFSPSGRLLAIAATNGHISLFSVDARARPVQIGRHVELHSTSLNAPHGVDFLSEDVIVVANRAGCVTFYRIPSVGAWEDSMTIDPIHRMESDWFGGKGVTRELDQRMILCGPGAVRVHAGQLFVCCNNASTVTAHTYQLRSGTISTGEGTLMAQTGLEIPDGVAVTSDGQWMAVSDHHHHRVLIHRLADGAHVRALRDVDLAYPHGLCFDAAGNRLYVADAGQNQVHVFASEGGWQSADSSTFKLPAVDMTAFHKTKEATPEQHRPLEGGIKGIDVDPSGRIVATTCRHQSLRFFEIQDADSRRPV